MTLKNLLDLTNGTLLNTPTIKKADEICLFLDKVKRGSIFFAFETDFKRAVKSGAYIIVSQIKPTIIDEEIAWIKVENLFEALLRVVRFRLLKQNITFYLVNEVEFEISKTIFKNNSIAYFSNSLKDIALLLEKDYIKYCLCFDKQTLLFLTSNFFTLQKKDILPQKESLFETNINHTLFKFSTRFAKELNALFLIFQDFLVNLAENETPFFRTFYLDLNFSISQTPTSKVLIIDKAINQEYIQNSKQFILKHFKWLKVGFFDEKTPFDVIKQRFLKEKLDIIYFEFNTEIDSFFNKIQKNAKEESLFG